MFSLEKEQFPVFIGSRPCHFPIPPIRFVWAGSSSFSGTILPLILVVPGLVTYAQATVHMYMLETGGYSTLAVPNQTLARGYPPLQQFQFPPQFPSFLQSSTCMFVSPPHFVIPKSVHFRIYSLEFCSVLVSNLWGPTRPQTQHSTLR